MSTTPARWRALDAFRGFAIVGMLLVNNPGDHDAVYAQLRHSAWHGLTFADLVFPFFLFVVGITTELAFRRDRPVPATRIVRRAAIILGIGLLLQWFPFYQSGPIPWSEHPGVTDRLLGRLYVLRIPGVLQRIAICYLATALLARRLGVKGLVASLVLILVGYWALLSLVTVPGEGLRGAMLIDQPARTLPAHIDRRLFDWSRWGLGNHLWDSTRTWDPEGALSTLSAAGTVLCGVLVARWMRRDARPGFARLALAASAAIAVGALWSVAYPVNKSLWTGSYVLVTAGISLLLLASMTWLLDRDARAGWAAPLIVFGENPLVAYAGSELGQSVLHSSIKIPSASGRLGTDEWVTHALSQLGAARPLASLLWALLYVALWYLLLRRLSRRGLFVRA